MEFHRSQPSFSLRTDRNVGPGEVNSTFGGIEEMTISHFLGSFLPDGSQSFVVKALRKADIETEFSDFRASKGEISSEELLQKQAAYFNSDDLVGLTMEQRERLLAIHGANLLTASADQLAAWKKAIIQSKKRNLGRSNFE